MVKQQLPDDGYLYKWLVIEAIRHIHTISELGNSVRATMGNIEIKSVRISKGPCRVCGKRSDNRCVRKTKYTAAIACCIMVVGGRYGQM